MSWPPSRPNMAKAPETRATRTAKLRPAKIGILLKRCRTPGKPFCSGGDGVNTGAGVGVSLGRAWLGIGSAGRRGMARDWLGVTRLGLVDSG